jgi:hypothetical protein
MQSVLDRAIVSIPCNFMTERQQNSPTSMYNLKKISGVIPRPPRLDGKGNGKREGEETGGIGGTEREGNREGKWEGMEKGRRGEVRGGEICAGPLFDCRRRP